MSKRDDLERLKNDWERHLSWREGRRMSMGNQDAPGTYRDDARSSGVGLRLTDLPALVREDFLRDIESIVATALDERYAARRQQLQQEALEEAKRTIAELGQ